MKNKYAVLNKIISMMLVFIMLFMIFGKTAILATDLTRDDLDDEYIMKHFIRELLIDIINNKDGVIPYEYTVESDLTRAFLSSETRKTYEHDIVQEDSLVYEVWKYMYNLEMSKRNNSEKVTQEDINVLGIGGTAQPEQPVDTNEEEGTEEPTTPNVPSISGGLSEIETINRILDYVEGLVREKVGANEEETISLRREFLNNWDIYEWENGEQYEYIRNVLNNEMGTDVNRNDVLVEVARRLNWLRNDLRSNVNATVNNAETPTIIRFFNLALSPFIWIFRTVVFILPSLIIQNICAGIAQIGGSNGIVFLTLEDILFNRVSATDVNIFSLNTINGQPADPSNAIIKIRTNIANWYYTIRNLTIVIQLCVLIYIAIRMAMSSIAQDQAKYKEMFINWLVGVILIFILHYVMLFIIHFNNSLVVMFENSVGTVGNDGTLYNDMLKLGLDFELENFATGFAGAICYFMLTLVVFGFLMMYIKRMIVTAFLTVIAPLVTVTYAIDKVADGKSQVLNSWLKEYTFNIIIQPFHCIVYIVFVRGAMEILANAKGSLASFIVPILSISFIFMAEGIVRKIFGVGGSHSGSGAASIAAFTAGLGTATKVFGKASGSIKDIRSKTGDLKQAVPGAKGGTVKDSNVVKSLEGKSKNEVKKDLKKSFGKRMADNAKKVATSTAVTGAAGAMLSAATTLVTSQGNEGAAAMGAVAGVKGGKQASSVMAVRAQNKQVKRNQDKFKEQYMDFRYKNQSVTDAQIQKYLDVGSLNDVPPDHQEFVASLQGMKKTYDIITPKESGQSKTERNEEMNDSVMSLIEQIRNETGV